MTLQCDITYVYVHIVAYDVAAQSYSVCRERSNKRRLKDTIAGFSMVCRGIAGTEYGHQTALSLQYR